MSQAKRLAVLGAVTILVLSLATTWYVADVRSARATDDRKAELADRQVSVRQAPSDYDGDGVADATDRCPTRPETTNGFRDGDGCPDVVTTTGAS